ncbi:hypothetical protein EYF80_001330 [Liparis tanakae]|uniref:Uncharacterized protein n=1 Tax=Liparis tanakae TaxID=230148 RepID=A0A4Z2JF00_9TELE|nr:hypothetical protein EYF80_001330 [Liparis tanakae]
MEINKRKPPEKPQHDGVCDPTRRKGRFHRNNKQQPSEEQKRHDPSGPCAFLVATTATESSRAQTSARADGGLYSMKKLTCTLFNCQALFASASVN